ncbi:hypothetical protein [Psychrobacter glacincola]|uniref:Uncharacterized protein n=1 Tax=Psychrobacter glacincola TaxID=56810 RepID=A0ABW1W914_9GAMM
MKKTNHDDLVENDAVAQHYCDWAIKLAHDWRMTGAVLRVFAQPTPIWSNLQTASLKQPC